MSKSKGNIVDPAEVLDTHGADAFRWYLYTSGPPGEPRRFSKELVGEVVSKFWLTLWNTYSFFVTYANIDGWTPDGAQPAPGQRDPLDRYVLAELNALVKGVTEAYENYDVTNATRPVQAFVEVLSNWYVRLSRRRFWQNEMDDSKRSAYATLHECLVTLSKLLAPAMPFLSDTLYRNLVKAVDSNATDSVHLALWPDYDERLIEQARIDEMRLVQRLVSLGRAARESVKIGVRQPLSDAQFVTRDAKERMTVEHMRDLIMAELNVKALSLLDEPLYVLNPLPQVLGKKFGKDFPRVQKALRDGAREDVQAWAKALLAKQNVSLTLDGATFEVTPDECQVLMKAPEGFAYAEEGGYMAVINTMLTDDLVLEGLAREVVRRVQSMRKDADYNITDNIVVRYVASDKLAQAIGQFGDYIKSETLAVTLEAAEPGVEFFRRDFKTEDESDIDGETLSVGLKRMNGAG
jgi:isoleucyl-tRNA synthetase